jgi:outer membrane protein W
MNKCFARRITVLSILTVFLIIPASTSFGQDVAPAGAGSKALLFSMVMLTPTAYNGGLGFKYYIADPFALRGDLEFGFAHATTPAPTGGSEGSESATQFGVSVGGEYHFLKSRVSPYGGLDVGIRTTSTDAKNTADPQTEIKNAAAGQAISGTLYTNGFNFRIGAIAGVEFFILKELSIGAEYNLGFSMTSLYDQVATTNTNPSTSVTTKEGTNSAVGINGTGAFTLAFYF